MEEVEEALELDARHNLYSLIRLNPGLHFRELQRRGNLAVGSLQYHLDYLQKKHLIRAEKSGKFVRFYAVKEAQLGESEKLMSLLRQESIRRIVLFLLKKRKANNELISSAVKLSPSTTSWHLSKLLEAGVVERKRKGRKTFFSVTDPEKVIALFISYKKSFLDDVVDRFVEIWEEI